MKKFLTVMIVTLVVCTFAFTALAQDKYTIGMSQCNLGEPWRVQMNADVKAAADQHRIWKSCI
jgi:ribose transport system substrate-binding protein